MALSTSEIMEISLDLVGWDEVPADSGIHVPGDELETALVGIDLESPEIQLAHNEGYDLVLAHHPPGGDPRVNFAPVLDKQIEFMTDHGVPEERAEEAASSIISGMEHAGHSANYRHDPSIAEHLDQPYMNVHLAPDELGRRRFREVADELDDDATVGAFADALGEIPEIDEAITDVELRVGERGNDLGEVAIHHAAGTNGGSDVASAYFDNGVDTVLYIHVGAGDTEALTEAYGDEKNLVVTGHIASDAIGLNVLIDELEARGVDCTAISGCGIGRE
jgi:putative NIF3 family GTP cyclohydrolase 1 type 2